MTEQADPRLDVEREAVMEEVQSGMMACFTADRATVTGWASLKTDVAAALLAFETKAKAIARWQTLRDVDAICDNSFVHRAYKDAQAALEVHDEH